MYSSPQQREVDIKAGARRTPGDLCRWAGESADRLAAAPAELDDDHWKRMVRTAPGRTVPAAEIPWLRSREVMVHAVDLDLSLGFEDLSEDFLLALVDDGLARRSSGEQPALVLTADGDRHTWTVPGRGVPIAVRGSVGGVAAYVVGRPRSDVASPSGTAQTCRRGCRQRHVKRRVDRHAEAAVEPSGRAF